MRDMCGCGGRRGEGVFGLQDEWNKGKKVGGGNRVDVVMGR